MENVTPSGFRRLEVLRHCWDERSVGTGEENCVEFIDL